MLISWKKLEPWQELWSPEKPTIWEERLTQMECLNFWIQIWPTRAFWSKEWWSQASLWIKTSPITCKRPQFINLRPLLREKDLHSTKESVMIKKRRKKPDKFIWKKEKMLRSKLFWINWTNKRKLKMLKHQLRDLEVKRMPSVMLLSTRSTPKLSLSTMRLLLRPNLSRLKLSNRLRLKQHKSELRLTLMRLLLSQPLNKKLPQWSLKLLHLRVKPRKSC